MSAGVALPVGRTDLSIALFGWSSPQQAQARRSRPRVASGRGGLGCVVGVVLGGGAQLAVAALAVAAPQHLHRAFRRERHLGEAV
jgi:hypothetical protein